MSFDNQAHQMDAEVRILLLLSALFPSKDRTSAIRELIQENGLHVRCD